VVGNRRKSLNGNGAPHSRECAHLGSKIRDRPNFVQGNDLCVGNESMLADRPAEIKILIPGLLTSFSKHGSGLHPKLRNMHNSFFYGPTLCELCL